MGHKDTRDVGGHHEVSYHPYITTIKINFSLYSDDHSSELDYDPRLDFLSSV